MPPGQGGGVPQRRPQMGNIPGAAMLGNLRALVGGRNIRYSGALDKLGNSPLVMRVPKDVLADEHNVVLGLPRTAYAAAANLPMAVNAPRQTIVRDMACEEVSLAVGAVGTRDYTLQAFTVESNALSLAVGMQIGVWNPVARNRPSIDLPCTGGSPVAVQWLNNSAVAGILAGAVYID